MIELFRFVIGAEVHLYTNSPVPVTYASEEYAPTAVSVGDVSGTEEMARVPARISVPRDAGIAARFAPGPPSTVVEVEVRRQDGGATTLRYAGRVMGAAFSGSQATLECESIYTSMRRSGLRRPHQILCPYALYDDDCGVNPGNFRVSATLASATADTLTAPAFSGQPDGWFTGGYIEWGTLPERRGIVGHTGDTITLSGPLSGPEAGDAVDAFAGCDHTFATCGEKFDNALNHGGMPFIPDKNPFGSDPIF